MANTSWFRRTLGIGLVAHDASTPDPEDWTKVRKVSSWGNTRRFRRFVVLLWVGMLVFDPWMVFRLAKSFVILAKLPELLLPTVSQLFITWLAFRGMQIGLSQPTIEDIAIMQHGDEFDSLTNTQREQLFQGRFRDFIFGRIHKDEREAELRLRAEGAAYRLLRPGVVAVVTGYWAVCLLGPFEPIRQVLVITAIAATWFAVAVLVLPTMVRMWTQPNEVGEPRVLRLGKVAKKC